MCTILLHCCAVVTSAYFGPLLLSALSTLPSQSGSTRLCRTGRAVLKYSCTTVIAQLLLEAGGVGLKNAPITLEILLGASGYQCTFFGVRGRISRSHPGGRRPTQEFLYFVFFRFSAFLLRCACIFFHARAAQQSPSLFDREVEFRVSDTLCEREKNPQRVIYRASNPQTAVRRIRGYQLSHRGDPGPWVPYGCCS